MSRSPTRGDATTITEDADVAYLRSVAAFERETNARVARRGLVTDSTLPDTIDRILARLAAPAAPASAQGDDDDARDFNDAERWRYFADASEREVSNGETCEVRYVGPWMAVEVRCLHDEGYEYVGADTSWDWIDSLMQAEKSAPPPAPATDAPKSWRCVACDEMCASADEASTHCDRDDAPAKDDAPAEITDEALAERIQSDAWARAAFARGRDEGYAAACREGRDALSQMLRTVPQHAHPQPEA